MKFLFIVQGDGRGHMTQALALKRMLERSGHEVAGVLIWKSPLREIPHFFLDKIDSKVTTFESPNFAPTAQNRKPELWNSILKVMVHAPTYFKSLTRIKQCFLSHQPDVVVNFYDLLGRLVFFRYRIKIPQVCIGHQYLMEHPDFKFPPKKKHEAGMVRLLSYFTSVRADLILALSLEPLKNLSDQRTIIVPPLLREEVLNATPSCEDFILGYMLNPGFSDEVVAWHTDNPNTVAHFFWDRKDVPEVHAVRKNLEFHQINDELFIEMLSRCKGYATTGGFESVCEAMYLGKPVMMVPAHIEQECNAYDAALHGAGIVSETFTVSKLTHYLPLHDPNIKFRNWAQKSESLFLKHLTGLPSKAQTRAKSSIGNRFDWKVFRPQHALPT